MKLLHEDLRGMLSPIIEFFRYMVDNEEGRLYYMAPPLRFRPYAYQQCPIRDIATICDLLDIKELSNQRKLTLGIQADALFESAVGNTLQDYGMMLDRGDFFSRKDMTIGDLGFLLLAFLKTSRAYPKKLPLRWQEMVQQIIELLLKRQRKNGSIRIYLAGLLPVDESDAEGFYLPEALIALTESLGYLEKGLEERVREALRKACDYCMDPKRRSRHLEFETRTFYANWQFQFLFHYCGKGLVRENEAEKFQTHASEILKALEASSFTKEPFASDVAVVEVACYFEGLVHAQALFRVMNWALGDQERWLEDEIGRSMSFLQDVQKNNLDVVHGGFVHSYRSKEARVDVAGHVMGGLCVLMDQNRRKT